MNRLTFHYVEGIPVTLGSSAVGLSYCTAWDEGGPRAFDPASARRNGTEVGFREFAALVDAEKGSIEALLPALVDVPEGVDLLIVEGLPVTLDCRKPNAFVALAWHIHTPQPFSLYKIVGQPVTPADRRSFFECRSDWLGPSASLVVIAAHEAPSPELAQIAGHGGILLESNWSEANAAENCETFDLDREIIDIAFVNEGLEIIALNRKGELQGFDAKTGWPKTKRVLVSNEAQFSALSADGRYLGWHTAQDVMVSADISWLTGGAKSGVSKIYHAQRALQSAPPRPMPRDVGPIHALLAKIYSSDEPRPTARWYPGLHARNATFSPDGTRITMGHEDGCASVWDVATGKLLFETPDVGHVMILADLSADGALLVTRALSCPPMVWCMQTGCVLAVLDGARDALPANRPNEVLVIGRDNSLRRVTVPTTSPSLLGRLFKGATPQTQLILETMTARSSPPWPSYNLHVAPDSRTAAILCEENKVQLVSLNGSKSTHIVKPGFPVKGCRYAADGAKLAIYGKSSYLQIVILGTG